MKVTVGGRYYTVSPVVEPGMPDSVIAELFNSRGDFAGYVSRDPACADAYVLFGSSFRRVSASEHGRVGRQIAEHLDR